MWGAPRPKKPTAQHLRGEAGALESDSALTLTLALASSLTSHESRHPFCARFPCLWNEENENDHGGFHCSIKFSFIVYKFYLYVICPA